MKTLSSSVSNLLDKLYNLRGEDSVILVEMESQREKAEETKARTTEQKANLQTKIAELHQQHEELELQGERLKDVLSKIDRDDYATVLDQLKIDFNPAQLVEKVNNTLPNTIETVSLEARKAEEELVKVEKEMNTSTMTIEELGIRKDAALANQDKLNEYFGLALSGRINITRDSITSLLEQFKFNEEEQREAAKVLMFPEDALYTYEEKIKTKEPSKSIEDVIQEPIIEPIIEPIVVPEVKEEVLDLKITPEVKEEPTVSENDPKMNVINLLKENGIDYLDFKGLEIDELIRVYDLETMISNIQYIKAIGLDTDIFINHVSIMLDKDLKDKIEVLLSVGKTKTDIYLNPSILVKYDLVKLGNVINTMKAVGMDPKNIPLMAY